MCLGTTVANTPDFTQVRALQGDNTLRHACVYPPVVKKIGWWCLIGQWRGSCDVVVSIFPSPNWARHRLRCHGVDLLVWCSGDWWLLSQMTWHPCSHRKRRRRSSATKLPRFRSWEEGCEEFQYPNECLSRRWWGWSILSSCGSPHADRHGRLAELRQHLATTGSYLTQKNSTKIIGRGDFDCHVAVRVQN